MTALARLRRPVPAMTRARARSLAAGFVSLLVFSSVVVLATRADGREASRATSNDGGAWLVDRRAGGAAHIEYTTRQPTVQAQLADPGAPLSAIQSPGVIAVHAADDVAPQVMLIDSANAARLSSTTMPPATEVRTRPGGLALLQPQSGRLWLVPAGVLAATEILDTVPPSFEGGGPVSLVVGQSGSVALVGGGSVIWPPDDPAGGDARAVTLPDGFTPSVATMTGSDRVVLVAGDRWLVVDGDRSRALELSEPVPVQSLQQEGLAPSLVGAVSSDGRVVVVDVETGAVTALGDPLSGPVSGRPILHGDCVHSLSGPAGDLRLRVDCLDGLTESTPQAVSDAAQLRLVNGEVWVDELDGSGWLVTPERVVEEVADFSDVFDDDTGEESADGEQVEQEVDQSAADAALVDADQLDADEENEPPVARDDEAATRLGRPVLVDVLANDTDSDGDVLLVTSAEIVEGADLGQLHLPTTQNSLQITPTGGPGTVRVRYQITDGSPGGTAEAVVTVAVLPLSPDGNRAPEPGIDRLVGAAGQIVTANLLDNDRDPDGDAVVLTGLEAVDGVELRSVHPGGDVVLALPPQFDRSTIEMPYVVADEWGGTAEGVLELTIRLGDSNLAPDARNDAGSTQVGRRLVLELLANDVDGNGDLLSLGQAPQLLSGPSAPAYQAVSDEGELTFEASAPGTYLLRYAASDGAASDPALVRIEVTEPEENRPPVAVRDDVTLSRGETRLVRAFDNDGDPDGDLVTVVQQTTNEFLDVELVPGVGFRVTMKPGAGTVEMFQYQISDGDKDSELVSVVVARSERTFFDAAPIAVDDAARVRAGRTSRLFVIRNDFDPEGGALTVVGAEAATGITATPAGDGQWVEVEVPADATAPFVVQYTISDEGGNVAAAQVDVALVAPTDPNTAPVARPDSAYTIEGEPIVIPVLANDTDPESDALRLSSVPSAPHGGSVTLAPGGAAYLYQPSPGFRGTDRFTYLVSDSEGAEATGEVQVAVARRPDQNRPPTAVPDLDWEVASGAGEVSLDVLANDTDPDGDPLVVIAVVGPARVSSSGRSVLFTPPDGVAEGQVASFTYRIADGRGGTSEAQVQVRIVASAEPLPPVAEPDTHGPVRAGSDIGVDVAANDTDPDGDPALLRVSSQAAGVRVVDNKLTLVAPAATAQVPYTITDPQGLSDDSYLTVVVEDNLPPVVSPADLGSFATDADIPAVDLSRYVTDPDGDELTFQGVSGQVGGITTFDAGARDQRRVTFSPSPDFSGVGGFSFTVSDGSHEVTGRVTVTLTGPSNRPPVGRDATVIVEAGVDQPFDLASLFTDPDDGDTLSFEVTGGPGASVSLEGSGGARTLRVPVTAAAGRTSFTVRATDRAGASDEVAVAVEILESKVAAPTAVPDSATTNQEKAVTVDVVANDIHTVNPRQLQVTNAFVDTAAGRVTSTGTSITYTPAAGFFGTAQIRYTIQDQRQSAAGRAEGLVAVTVVGRPSAPGGVTATAAGLEAVLSWPAPSGNGAPVEGYRVRVNGSQVLTVNGTSPSYRFTGGTAGNDYVFEVLAFNAAGDGPWSAPSNTVRLDVRPSPPGQPTATFVAGAPGQLTVTWVDGANEGSAITAYTVEIGNCASGTRQVGARSYVWSGLTNGSSCRFRVTATNKAGDSLPSSWSQPECPADVPAAPAAPSVVRGDKQAQVTWSVPRNPDCNDPTGYELVRYRGGAVDGTTNVPYGSVSWLSAPLANGATYSFAVRAVNRAGPGALSAPSGVVVPCGKPLAPPSPTATAGDKTVTLVVGDGDDNGCRESGKVVSVNGGAAVPLAASGQITGLTNGQTYTFRVAETNEIGTGDFSAASTAVVPFGKPLAPRIQAVVSGATYRWQIDGADPNGSPITGYTLTGNVAGFTSTGSGGSGRCTNAQGNDCIPAGGATQGPPTACLQSAVTVTVTGLARNAAGDGVSATQSQALSGCPSAPSLSLAADASGFTANFSRPAGAAAVYVEIDGSYGSPVAGSSVRRDAPAGSTHNVRAWACNEFGCQASGAQSVRVPDPPRPAISLGRSVRNGQSYIVGSGSNFPAGEQYWIRCSDSRSGTFVDTSQNRPVVYATRRVDGAGNLSWSNDICWDNDPLSVSVEVWTSSGARATASIGPP